MSIPGYDRWLTSGPGGPDDDQADWCHTRAEYEAVQDIFDELGEISFRADLPAEIVKTVNYARQFIAEWLEQAKANGVEPSNDPADRYNL